MLFSGPIQPPMLGAAVASARLHLDDRFPALQGELEARLDVCLTELLATKVDLTTRDLSPIFQVPCDSPRVAFAVAERMRARGFYCCVCVFPAVPMNRPGLRFTVTCHNEPDDIAPFVRALVASVEEARREIAVGGRSGEMPEDRSFEATG